jgi:hypothetical protein
MHIDRLLKMVRTGSIIGVLLLAMFVIDMRESFKFQSLSHSAHDHSNTIVSGGRLQEYYQYQSQYFRAQRNYYLSGFSLFLLVYVELLVCSPLLIRVSSESCTAGWALSAFSCASRTTPTW